jgi:hypothetical protein
MYDRGNMGNTFGMQRWIALCALCALGVLSACAPTVPDSGPGSLQEQQARDAALAQPGLPSPYAISDETLMTPLSAIPASDNSDIAAEAAAALAATSASSGVAPVTADSATIAPLVLDTPGISTENDFSAVSQTQTIQSDADRLASNRAQYQVIEPTALPERTGNDQPNIVAYALQTNNPMGVKIYSRGAESQSKYTRNCAKYGSPDQAQMDFLDSGGPNKDSKGLDPDGDGFACAWDPTPFRAAKSN